jgi:pimeloyl-ACP methyl ester carboxylesterase
MSSPRGRTRNFGLLMLGILVTSASLGPLVFAQSAAVSACAAPAQGARVRSDRIRITTSGDASKRFAILEPIGLGKTLPLVFFFHGWDGTNPKYYGAWLDYLVGQGQVVVFVGYQETHSAPTTGVMTAAYATLLAALAELRRPGHESVDFARSAAIGYSLGASIALNLALTHQFPGVPPIRGLFLANPADAPNVQNGKRNASIWLDWRAVPNEVYVIGAVGEHDRIASTGRQLFGRLCSLPPSQRKLVILKSDTRRGHALKADHMAPTAYSRFLEYDPSIRVSTVLASRPVPWCMTSVNQLDIEGYWKLADIVLDVTFSRGRAPADDTILEFSGVWPDGSPVTRAQVDETPCPPSDQGS